MCCFSGKVEHVADTRIFARFTGERRQGLVYQMTYITKTPVAMILPIPTPAKSPEDSVKFVSLEKYPGFFDDLKKGFPEPKPRGAFGGGLGGLGNSLGDRTLAVEDVGSFVASFVPTIADFARLDERFRLPDATWKKLPAYSDYGFAVFQLKPESETVHPMAFTFPTRPKGGLFFPTVHIHDGDVHARAEFDHDLYLQPRDATSRPPRGWKESVTPAEDFVKIEACKNLLDGELHCYRLQLLGEMKNQDTWL